MITSDTVNRIVTFKADGLPVLSLYARYAQANGDPTIGLRSTVASLLHEIRPLTDAQTLSHQQRLSLRDDIAGIEDILGREKWRPGSIAFFACSGAGLFETVQMPRTVRDRAVVDATPWVRPMLAVLDEYYRYCVVVVDEESAQFWELYQDEMSELDQVSDQVLRKRDYGGWYGLKEHSVRNKADELVKRHFRRVVGTLGDLFRQGDYELVVVGGHDHEVPRFLEFLPKDLRARVAGTFSIDRRTATKGDIRKNADAVVDQYERDEETRHVSDVLERAAAGGPAAVGLTDCLWAGSVAAIQVLLIEDGASSPGVVCDESGWLGTSETECPLCGRPTRSTADVIDELVTAVIDEGGATEHVRAETDLRQHKMAASLRFPLPARP